MPELPEVETVVRSLRPHLVGHALGQVWTSGLGLRLGRPLDLKGLRRLTEGASVSAIGRRGKYIVIELASGAILLVHLGMSGRLRVHTSNEPRAKHTHVTWDLPGRRELRFIDPRRFGWVEAAAEVGNLSELRGLGPDPLTELRAQDLEAMLATSRAPLKSFLLDQRRIAGLGNIYVCEAMFRAGIHPARPARRVRRRAGELLQAIRQTLDLGIANCGTSFRDFVDGTGTAGRNAMALLVYGREGKPCTRCGGSIRRRVDAGRSTFYCASCQTH